MRPLPGDWQPLRRQLSAMGSSVNIAFADCFSGVSGDMFLGALLHCGLSEQLLRSELEKLEIGEWHMTITETSSCGIGGLKVDISSPSNQQFRHLSTIREILERSSLHPHIRSQALAVFSEIARAEAKVHGIDIDRVHFHEVGAVDTIIDVVGTVAGLHHQGITRLYAAPLPSPRGFVSCSHGTLPLPAPAVCEILKGVPCYGVEQHRELVTPTGAALLKVLAQSFGPMPPMTTAAVGYGAGSHSLEGDQPNLFRLITGTARDTAEHQEVAVIESHLDDWNGEGFGHLCDVLFAGGALDVSLTPMQMKKGRPGYDLQIIAPLYLAEEMRRTVFVETTSIGVRYRRELRQTLPRQVVEIKTPWGTLSAKRVETPAGARIYPEYEECRRLAREHKVALQLIYDTVRSAAQQL